MRPKVWISAFLVGVWLVCGVGRSPCDYTPPESHLRELKLRGDVRWHDDAYADDRGSTLSGTLQTSFRLLSESPETGWGVDAQARTSLSGGILELALSASASGRSYWENDLFGVGSLALSAELPARLDGDLTAGIGLGRFRDVTPLAQAIRVQNTLLDERLLVAPLPTRVLDELAAAFGAVGLSTTERLIRVEQVLIDSGLLEDGALGVPGLVSIIDIVERGEIRLCGWSIQARAGVRMMNYPTPRISEAIVLAANWAQVPDPVSQWTAAATWITDLRLAEAYTLEASLRYTRRLPGGWRAEGAYRFVRRTGEDDEAEHRHLATGELRAELGRAVSLAITGELAHVTGYEEPAVTVSVHLTYDVF